MQNYDYIYNGIMNANKDELNELISIIKIRNKKTFCEIPKNNFLRDKNILYLSFFKIYHR